MSKPSLIVDAVAEPETDLAWRRIARCNVFVWSPAKTPRKGRKQRAPKCPAT